MLPYELDEKGIHDLFITIDAIQESLRRIKEIQDTIPDFDITPFKVNADNSAQIL